TNPQHEPWAVPRRVLNHDVPCKFCYKSICPEGHHNCLRLVSPSEIVDAACALLRETGALTPHADERTSPQRERRERGARHLRCGLVRPSACGSAWQLNPCETP